MQETQCPQCGEWLGVPPEFADRAVKCGACGRVIQPHERATALPLPPPDRSGPRFPSDDPARSRGPRFPDQEEDYQPPRRKGGPVWLWLLLTFGGLGCCGCGGFGLLAMIAANSKWEPYTPEGGAFTAEFPGEPVYQSRPFQWNDGKTGTSHEYAAVRPLNTQAFAVHYTDLPKSLKGKLRDETLLKYGLEDLETSNSNFKVLSSEEVTAGGHKGMDIEGTMSDPKHGMLQVSVRVLIVGDRVFTLIAAGKDKKKLTPEKNRFFDSFKPVAPNEKADEPKEK